MSLKKITGAYLSVFTLAFFVITSYAAESNIVGLWESTQNEGSIEFKASGEVIFVDNMSATVTGTYERQGGGLIMIKLIATDILRDSIEAMAKESFIAKATILNNDELQLHIDGEDEVENYRRVR